MIRMLSSLFCFFYTFFFLHLYSSPQSPLYLCGGAWKRKIRGWIPCRRSDFFFFPCLWLNEWHYFWLLQFFKSNFQTWSIVWSVRLRVRYGDCNSKFSMKKKKDCRWGWWRRITCWWFSCSREIFLASFIVNLTDVQTVRSLVEEMETESNEEITESEQVQQGLGKRVIGKYRHHITVWLVSWRQTTRLRERQDQIRLVDNFMPHRFHIGDGTQ